MGNTFKAGAVVAVVLLLAGIAGRFDYHDEIRQAVAYCENVRAGIWPDYEGTAKHCPAVMAEAARVLGGAK